MLIYFLMYLFNPFIRLFIYLFQLFIYLLSCLYINIYFGSLEANAVHTVYISQCYSAGMPYPSTLSRPIYYLGLPSLGTSTKMFEQGRTPLDVTSLEEFPFQNEAAREEELSRSRPPHNRGMPLFQCARPSSRVNVIFSHLAAWRRMSSIPGTCPDVGIISEC